MINPRHLAAVLSLLLALSPAASAQATDSHSQHVAQADHDLQHTAVRLIFADGAGHSLKVFDPAAGEVIASFDTVGRMSGLETGPGGRYIYGIHRDDSRVTVLDSGLLLIPHGDHDDLQVRRPYVVGTLNVGQGPTHFTHTDTHVGFFNDSEGSVALLPEDLIGISNEMNVVEVAQPEHGAPVIMGDYLLSGGLSTARVDAYRLSDGRKVGSYPGCQVLHGAAHLNNTAYFGCADGVMVLDWQGDRAKASIIPNPARTPEGTRVGMLSVHPASPLIYGNFGRGLSYWKPGARAMKTVALSGQARGMEFSQDGTKLYVLTDDGQLHRLNAATAKLEGSVPVIGAFQGGEKTASRPDFVLAGGDIWVSSPATGELIQVDGASLKITHRYQVGGQPSHLAASQFSGVEH